MDYGKEFQKYATKHLGISSLRIDEYTKLVSQSGGIYGLTPNIIEERQMNASVIDIFSRLMMDRIIFLGVPIYEDVANIIMGQLLFLESANPNRDIQIYINSPGGSVYAGLAIYDTMQYISSDVATICTGMAASMGAVLMCAGAHGKRTALPHSRIMIHQPLGGFQGQATDINIHAKEILRMKDELNALLAELTGQAVEKVEGDTERDYFMSAADAKQYGLIDAIVTRKTSSGGES